MQGTRGANQGSREGPFWARLRLQGCLQWPCSVRPCLRGDLQPSGKEKRLQGPQFGGHTGSLVTPWPAEWAQAAFCLHWSKAAADLGKLP